MLLKIKERIVVFFNPGAHSKDHDSIINHWIWILIIGCACYLIILDEVFPKSFDKTLRKITIFPFVLFIIYEAKFLFKWSRIARIKNDTLKNVLVYLVVSASLFLIVWSFGKEAIANNLHLILGYHLMSVVWLIYVYSKKNKPNQKL
jgi:hypothetical protein